MGSAWLSLWDESQVGSSPTFQNPETGDRRQETLLHTLGAGAGQDLRWAGLTLLPTLWKGGELH